MLKATVVLDFCLVIFFIGDKGRGLWVNYKVWGEDILLVVWVGMGCGWEESWVWVGLDTGYILVEYWLSTT